MLLVIWIHNTVVLYFVQYIKTFAIDKYIIITSIKARKL